MKRERIHYENFSCIKGGCPPEYLTAGIGGGDEPDIDLSGFMNGESDYVTVATTESGKLVGLHVFNVESYSFVPQPDRLVLGSCATWVDKRYRGRGIAQEMWTVSLNAVRVRKVSVYCITSASEGLVRKVARSFPRLVWDIQVSERVRELVA